MHLKSHFFRRPWIVLLISCGSFAAPALTPERFSGYPNAYFEVPAGVYTTQERIHAAERILPLFEDPKSLRGIPYNLLWSLVHVRGDLSVQQRFLEQMGSQLNHLGRRIRRFDPHMNFSDAYRAISNHAVIFLLEKLFSLPVRITNATFGYSMLYPLTDNILDNPKLENSQKMQFGKLFGEKISKGSKFTELEVPLQLQENYRKVWKSFGLIERRYHRDRYPGVYESLEGIHKAQIASHAQNLPLGSFPSKVGTEERTAFEKQVFEITVAKGSASVVADAYLLRGNPSPLEVQFAAKVGVIVQMINDLSTLEQDIAVEGHFTPPNLISSRLAQHPEQAPEETRRNLDHFINSLFYYIHEVFSDPENELLWAGANSGCWAFRKDKPCDVSDFHRNIETYLMIEVLTTIAMNSKFHSPEFIAHMQNYFPIPFEILGQPELQPNAPKKSYFENRNANQRIRRMVKAELERLKALE